MSNPRDTGRWDAINQQYVDQQVKIDFAWGNIPMQPNDDREEPLDPELDSHIIATSGYQNFPAFTRGGIFDDTEANVSVPNLVGLDNPTAAQAALADAGLVLGDTNSSQVGANSGNNGKVKSQSPVAGTLVNEGDSVDIIVYDNPVVNVPDARFLSLSDATSYLAQYGLVVGTVTTSTVGATSQNNGKVKSQSPSFGTPVAPGTAVNLVTYSYVGANTNIAGFSISSFPGHPVPGGGTVYMFLFGRTTKPTAGSTITIANSNNSSMNRNWTVDVVEDNDSYNTGGTVVTMTAQGVGVVADPASTTGATWITV